MNHLHPSKLTPLFLLLSVGCAGMDYQLSAEDQLLIDAIAGDEDPTVRGSSDGGEGAATPPPMQRECDSEGTYTGLFSHYDTDDSRQLDKGECSEVDSDHARMDDRKRHDLLRVLTLVYDQDLDGTLGDTERNQLLTDFSARCTVMQDRLLTDFDTDADGQLSDAELQTAHETLKAEHEQIRGECGCEGGPPGGDGQDSGGPVLDQRPEGPPPSCFVDTLVAEFDSDGDGELSADEQTQLQDTVRERILAGERFHAN